MTSRNDEPHMHVPMAMDEGPNGRLLELTPDARTEIVRNGLIYEAIERECMRAGEARHAAECDRLQQVIAAQKSAIATQAALHQQQVRLLNGQLAEYAKSASESKLQRVGPGAGSTPDHAGERKQSASAV